MSGKNLSRTQRCKQIDIVDFARSKGLAVVSKGKDHRLEDHNSFVFDQRKQRFYWNSQGISGDIIDLSKLFFVDDSITDSKKQFQMAMDVILDEKGAYDRVENLSFVQDDYLDHPEDYQPLTDKSRTYLTENRKISESVINYFEKEGILKELKPKNDRQNYLVRDERLDHAVAFLWRDKDTQEIVGASYQGILLDHERFGDRETYKHIDRNSTAQQGFNIQIGDPKNLKFFESSLDMMSYASLNRDNVKDSWLISMEGLKKNVIDHYFGESVRQLIPNEMYPETMEICVDNDAAGQMFFESVQELGRANPHNGNIVKCERMIANDYQLPKDYKPIYEKVAKEHSIELEALMAVHKTENNLQLNERLAVTPKIDLNFAKVQKVGEVAETFDLEERCQIAASKLSKCKDWEGKCDFDKFYKNPKNPRAEILLSVKAEHFYEKYKEHKHEWVSEVKKDWNDQLKHESAMIEKRKVQRAQLFKEINQER